jgi:hypothetical protein
MVLAYLFIVELTKPGFCRWPEAAGKAARGRPAGAL